MPVSFHEVRFPTGIAFGASAGPERKTEIVTLGSGFEERNAVWANSRRRYDAGLGVKSLNDLHAAIAFFEARLGRLYGFRFKDFSDWKSCAPLSTPMPSDQTIGVGDGTTATFQLVKKYTSGAGSWTRQIKKPVAGTVLIALDGVNKTLGTHFTVDTTTGVVTFLAGHIPFNGGTITSGFEFDVPVRFDSDTLSINLDSFRSGEVPSIPIIEIRV